MDIVLDTCLFLRNDANQSAVPGFDYTHLETLLKDRSNSLFVSGFSLPEIYALRHYQDIDDLIVGLAIENVQIASYSFPHFGNELDKSDPINKYSATAHYHLTQFLEFFVFEVMVPLKLDDLDSFMRTVHESTEAFYKGMVVNFSNCTDFMKKTAVDYIVHCIMSIFNKYGKTYSEQDVWRLIAKSKIGSLLSRDIDKDYLRYGRFLAKLFSEKLKNGAKKIKLDFGFNDLLIARSSKDGYIVVSSDKDLCRYLLKYGNSNNKTIINKLWNNKLKPADY